MATAVIKDHASQKRRNFISKFLIYFFLIVITACMLLPFLGIHWMGKPNTSLFSLKEEDSIHKKGSSIQAVMTMRKK